MDKYEYKVRAEEIKELIEKGEYAQAAEIADTIDWRRVKSVMMLCTISDLYKINRRYEDARDMMLLAYDRRPGGRNICYALCDLSIKLGDLVHAMEYYKEFVQVAPRDAGKYILQYKLYEDQEVSLEERIAVLEELKRHEYREKWAYELAYLYHRIGLATKCVEECDELIAFFGEGEYVIKAMELKMLHQPLTAKQQEIYDARLIPGEEFPEETEPSVTEEELSDDGVAYTDEAYAEDGADFVSGDTQIYDADQVREQTIVPEVKSPEDDIQVKTLDMGQFNTINIQAELAEGVKAYFRAEEQKNLEESQKGNPVGNLIGNPIGNPIEDSIENPVENPEESPEIYPEEMQEQMQEEIPEEDLQETGDEGISDPITRSIIAPMMYSDDTESLDYPEIDEVDEEDVEPVEEHMESSEVFFGETGEIVLDQIPREELESRAEKGRLLTKEQSEEQAEIPSDAQAQEQPEDSQEPGPAPVVEQLLNQFGEEQSIADWEAENRKKSEISHKMRVVEPPKEMARVLSQEADGQISLVVPERESVEKQITGQMNIEEVLAEWERMKKENEEKRKEEVRRHVLQQTGSMFTEFEAKVRDGLLEKLEKGEAISPEEAVSDESATEENVIEESVTEENVAEENVAEENASEENISEDSPAAEKEFVMLDEQAAADNLKAQSQVERETVQGSEDVAETGPATETEMATEAEMIAEAEMTAEAELKTDAEVTAEAGLETEAEVEYEAETEAGTIEEGEAEAEIKAEIKSEKAVHSHTKTRSMTREEKELYNAYISSSSTKEQIVRAVDNISLAAYTGNVIITGEAGMDTITLAKNMIRELQYTDSNFSGKVAKISGQGLNRKKTEDILNQLQNGALIIQNACGMNENTIQNLYKALQKESLGIVVILQDEQHAMEQFLEDYPGLLEVFTARVNVEALSNDMLVAHGRKYAKEKEYSIDELGALALHHRIEELSTIDHAVSLGEVEEIVDEAILRANRKTPRHFFDILFAKRYDEEDMIVVTERDFA